MYRSEAVKSDESSERMNVSSAVSPALSEEVSELMAMVGKPFMSLSPTIPVDCLLVEMALALPVSVVIAEALMATVVLLSRVLRAAASTEVSVMVMS